ncbi:MAG: VanZ family protein [Pseudomonadota bacterium]
MQPIVRPDLRFPRFWLLGGLTMVLIITFLSLMPGDKLPDAHLSDKVEHILAYVALALWFGGIMTRSSYLLIVLALLAFGVLIELLQGGMGWGRQADLLDLGADAVGIAAGLLLALTPVGRWARWLESLQHQIAR